MRTVFKRLVFSILTLLLIFALPIPSAHGAQLYVSDAEGLAAALYQRVEMIQADADTIDGLLEDVLNAYPVLGFDFNGYEGAIRGNTITMKMQYRNEDMLPLLTADSAEDLRQTVARAATQCIEEVHILMPASMRDQDFGAVFTQAFSDSVLARTMLSSRSWEIWVNSYTDALYMSLKLEYEIDTGLLRQRKQQTEAEALRLARSLYYEGAEDAVLSLLAHDALVNRCAYDNTVFSDAENHSAYGALINGKAVCEGYAEAFQLLMDIAGIECLYIEGEASERHGWNMVRLADGYYHVDVTWDDPVAADGGQHLLHDYFLVSDAVIGKTHTWINSAYPAAQSNLWSAELAQQSLSAHGSGQLFSVQYTPQCDDAAVQAYDRMLEDVLRDQLPSVTALPDETTATSGTTQTASDTTAESSNTQTTESTGSTQIPTSTTAESTSTANDAQTGISKGALYVVWGILIVFVLGILYAKFIH